MEKLDPQVKPENMFLRSPDEAYAGYTTSDWEDIVNSPTTLKSAILDCLKPARVNDIEAISLECDICRQSYRPLEPGKISESPVSLPCGHMFGKDCISNWIFYSHPRENEDDVDVAEWIRVDEAFRPESTMVFSCPKCRAVHRAEEVGPQTVAARLRFWDSAYEILGIVRSAEEEVFRQGLVRFVEKQEEESIPLGEYERRTLKWRCRLAVVRFALRRARSDLHDTQIHLRDAIFNLACFGLNDPEGGYRAENYEDRPPTPWCWEYDQSEGRLMPRPNIWDASHTDWVVMEMHIGDWRRNLFAEALMEDEVEVEEMDGTGQIISR